MPATLTIRDEVLGGSSTAALTLELLTDEITVRELIRERVQQEVRDHNAREARGAQQPFQGLVQPTDSEATLNGYELREGRKIDWEPQYDRAIEAFEARQVLVLVDDRQAESLEERIVVSPRTEVTFLKLVPLVGG